VGGDQFIGVLAGDGGDVDHYHDDERRGELLPGRDHERMLVRVPALPRLGDCQRRNRLVTANSPPE